MHKTAKQRPQTPYPYNRLSTREPDHVAETKLPVIGETLLYYTKKETVQLDEENEVILEQRYANRCGRTIVYPFVPFEDDDKKPPNVSPISIADKQLHELDMIEPMRTPFVSVAPTTPGLFLFSKTNRKDRSLSTSSDETEVDPSVSPYGRK